MSEVPFLLAGGKASMWSRKRYNEAQNRIIVKRTPGKTVRCRWCRELLGTEFICISTPAVSKKRAMHLACANAATKGLITSL